MARRSVLRAHVVSIGTLGPADSGPLPASRRPAGTDTETMNTTLGIHCAEELVRLGVPKESALRALMTELELSRTEADQALESASEHVDR